MANEIMVQGSKLREGDHVGNYCGILVGVTVHEVGAGWIVVARADGSQFRTSVPADARILVRSPRPGLKAVA
jgi:hypothetical protein